MFGRGRSDCPGTAESRRASITEGGSPGGSDGEAFAGTTSDELLEYALVDPLAGVSASVRNFEVNGSFDDYLVATVHANAAADDAEILIEFSADLESWQRGTAVYLGSDEQSGGVTLRHWRSPVPVSAGTPLRYARVVLKSRP